MGDLRKIEFCCKRQNGCPVVQEAPDNKVVIGGEEEGITTWDKGQFSDFVEAAKAGKFDQLLA